MGYLREVRKVSSGNILEFNERIKQKVIWYWEFCVCESERYLHSLWGSVCFLHVDLLFWSPEKIIIATVTSIATDCWLCNWVNRASVSKIIYNNCRSLILSTPQKMLSLWFLCYYSSPLLYSACIKCDFSRISSSAVHLVKAAWETKSQHVCVCRSSILYVGDGFHPLLTPCTETWGVVYLDIKIWIFASCRH